MKTLILMTLSLSFMNAFAEEPKIEIPKNVLDRHVQACPEFNTERGEWPVKEVHTLPNYGPEVKSHNKLYLLGCELYAYNSSERAYIVSSYGDITDVAVVEVDNEGNFGATTNLMGSGYDPETQQLFTFSKGRGIGDCGASATYKYSPRNERFVLVEQRLKEECDGEETDWPVIFPKN